VSSAPQSAGMLCGPSKPLGAIRIVKETIEYVLGSHAGVRELLVAMGFAPEAHIGPAERARLYAGLWNLLAGGYWTLPAAELERRLRGTLNSVMIRAFRAGGVAGVIDRENVNRILEDSTRVLTAEHTDILTCTTVLRSTPADAKETAKVWEETHVPFPALADAFEVLVQHPETLATKAAGSVLLWRLYALFRIAEGFPVGAPLAVSPDTAFGFVSESSFEKLAGTASERSFVASVRPTLCTQGRYVVDIAPGKRDGSVAEGRVVDLPAPPTVLARRFALSLSGEGGSAVASEIVDEDDRRRHEMLVEVFATEALPRYLALTAPSWADLCWSPRYPRVLPLHVAFGDRKGDNARRAWWSFGRLRVLDLFVDEDDAARMPALRHALADASKEVSATSTGGVTVEEGIMAGFLVSRLPPGSSQPVAKGPTGLVEPRKLEWFHRFTAKVMSDPHASAAVSRWLFMVLAHPGSCTTPGSAQVVLSELEPSADALTELGKANPRGYKTVPSLRPILEVGGPALTTHMMALWWRLQLECAISASAKFDPPADFSASVGPRFQLPIDMADSSGAPAARPASPTSAAVSLAGPAAPARVILEESTTAKPVPTVGWNTLVSEHWEAFKLDVLFAAYCASFPPPTVSALGFSPTFEDLAAEGMVTMPSRSPRAADGRTFDVVPTWESTAQFMGTPAGDWDGLDPYSMDARWVCYRDRIVTRPLVPYHCQSSSMVKIESESRGAGRCSVMHWIAESCSEHASAASCGSRLRGAGVLGPLSDLSSDAADEWATALGIAVWAQAAKAARWRITQSPPDAGFAFLKWGSEAPTPEGPSEDQAELLPAFEGLTRSTGFEADILACALGVGSASAWSRELAGNAGLEAQVEAIGSVRAWARSLVGQRPDGSIDPHGKVGWDTILALACWRDVEVKLPLNAGGLVDLNPAEEREAVDPLDDGLEYPYPFAHSWLQPARVFALFIVLSQLKAPEIRNWAHAAKLAYYRSLVTPTKSFFPTALIMGSRATVSLSHTQEFQGRLWRALYSLRDVCEPDRLTADHWATATFQGADSAPGASKQSASVTVFARALYLAGFTSKNLADQLFARRKAALGHA
jgi:hypothetical protein